MRAWTEIEAALEDGAIVIFEDATTRIGRLPISRKIQMDLTRREYQEAVSLLDNLIDEVGENESHLLVSLMEVLGVLIEKYEDEHVPEITAL